ncbi:hypothetical protein BHM03_00016536 [Ensete ventricosum]|nr:hypothetical protein BHM03_00016536 [Ensete ventricosum]
MEDHGRPCLLVRPQHATSVLIALPVPPSKPHQRKRKHEARGGDGPRCVSEKLGRIGSVSSHPLLFHASCQLSLRLAWLSAWDLVEGVRLQIRWGS